MKLSLPSLAEAVLHRSIASHFILFSTRQQSSHTAKDRIQAYFWCFIFTTRLLSDRAFKLAAIFSLKSLPSIKAKAEPRLSMIFGFSMLPSCSASLGVVAFEGFPMWLRGDKVDFKAFVQFSGERTGPMDKWAVIFLVKFGLRVISSGSVRILLLAVLAERKGSSIVDRFRESYRFSRRLVLVMGCLLLADRPCEMVDSVFSEVALVSSAESFLLVRLNLPAGEVGSEGGSSSLELELTLFSCSMIGTFESQYKYTVYRRTPSTRRKVAPP